MFRQLEYILSETGLGLSGIELYSVLSGPGSFTGLRVGLAAVKGWAEVYDRPIAAVSGLEAVAAQAPVLRGTIAAVQDARRGQIFGATFRRNREVLVPQITDCVASPDEFLRSLAAGADLGEELVFASTAPEIIREAVAKSPFADRPVVRVSSVLAPIVGKLGLERAARGDLVSALELDAAYIRHTDAEMHWKQL
jgi:tRNA threonylcarbamoyladenosine biosynthesis protein TsaB